MSKYNTDSTTEFNTSITNEALDIIKTKCLNNGFILSQLIFNKDIESLKILIDSGVSVNFIDKSGASPLQYAIWTGNIDAAKLLVDAGANGSDLLPQLILDKKSEFIEIVIKGMERANLHIPCYDAESPKEIYEKANKMLEVSKLAKAIATGSELPEGVEIPLNGESGLLLTNLLRHLWLDSIDNTNSKQLYKLLLSADNDAKSSEELYEHYEQVNRIFKIGQIAKAIATGSELPEDFDIKLDDVSSSLLAHLIPHVCFYRKGNDTDDTDFDIPSVEEVIAKMNLLGVDLNHDSSDS